MSLQFDCAISNGDSALEECSPPGRCEEQQIPQDSIQELCQQIRDTGLAATHSRTREETVTRVVTRFGRHIKAQTHTQKDATGSLV